MRAGSCFLTTLAVAMLTGGGFVAGVAWSQRSEPAAPAESAPAIGTAGEASGVRQVSQRAGLGEGEKTTIALFEAASPSVAYITTTAVQQDIFSMNVMQVPQGSGSGFIWDRAGHVVTNYHVIAGADAAQVTPAAPSSSPARRRRAGPVATSSHVLAGADAAQVPLADHSSWPARLVGEAPERDLAVLRIEAPADRLRPIPVGSSAEPRGGRGRAGRQE